MYVGFFAVLKYLPKSFVIFSGFENLVEPDIVPFSTFLATFFLFVNYSLHPLGLMYPKHLGCFAVYVPFEDETR